jgi:hypothetical protein
VYSRHSGDLLGTDDAGPNRVRWVDVSYLFLLGEWRM